VVAEGTIALMKGMHEIVVGYVESGGDQAFDVGWKIPGGEAASIPAEVLFRPKTRR